MCLALVLFLYFLLHFFNLLLIRIFPGRNESIGQAWDPLQEKILKNKIYSSDPKFLKSETVSNAKKNVLQNNLAPGRFQKMSIFAKFRNWRCITSNQFAEFRSSFQCLTICHLLAARDRGPLFKKLNSPLKQFSIKYWQFQ